MVYFAQRNGAYNTIQKIQFHEKFAKRVVKKEIYQIQNRICAMELDHESQQLSVFKNNKNELQNEALYILDEEGIIHELIANSNGSHTCSQQIDFSEHDLKEIVDDDWGRAHISRKAIIYKDIIYLS